MNVKSKNVLIISSSPRKAGNSDTLADSFLKGATQAGHTVEKIFLKDKKINYCTGCGICVNKNGTCSQTDDMGEIAQKILKADVIVLATPVYFYTMDAQMKTLIDRCCAYYTLMGGKDFYFIVTAADTDISSMQRTIEGFRGFTDCIPNTKEKGIVYGVGVWHKGEINNKPEMQTAYNMGKNV